MNKRVHRLVFDRKRGMRVPAAECTRSAGKAAGGQSRAVAVACAALLGGVAVLGDAQSQTMTRSLSGAMQRSGVAWANRTNPGSNLPVHHATQTRGADVGNFDFKDSTDTRLMVNQKDQRVIINWDSFNVGRGYAVQFNQPEKGSALNKIWDLKPSVILGSIKANGEVILESQNGSFIFGSGARVESSNFVVSALAVANDRFKDGLLRNSAIRGGLGEYLSFDGTGALPYYVDDQGVKHLRGVFVERGAEIKALPGGDVILVGPAVYNEGRIETPSGQTILAAGQQVYLMSVKGGDYGLDQTQRGLVVAVNAYQPNEADPLPEGTNVVEQAEAGTYKTVNGETVDDSTPDGTAGLVKKINAVVAEKGSINLVGMAIRQNGVLSATTAVKGQNGVITLEASKTAITSTQSWKGGVQGNGVAVDTDLTRPIAGDLGSIEFGANSVTQVTPATRVAAPGEAGYDKATYEQATQTDGDTFLRSRISVLGSDILVKGGAQISARAGNIDLLAAESTQAESVTSFVIGGTGVKRDASRIVIESGAVIDASGQRDVALPMSRNQLSGRLFKSELSDSPVQRDGVLYRQPLSLDARTAIDVGNVKGFYEGIRRDALEWSTLGGNIKVSGSGSVQVNEGAGLDVSGGSVRYDSGVLATSSLRKGQRVVAIADAKAGERYDELIAPAEGQVQALPGYAQGFDAGSITLSGAGSLMAGLSGVRGDVVIGPTQRNGAQSGAYTYDRASRAIGRPTILTNNPHLYGSLRPQAFTLNIGQMFASDTAPTFTMPRILVSAQAQSVPEGTSVISLANMKTPLGALTLSAESVVVDSSTQITLAPTGSVDINARSGIEFAGQLDAAGAKVTFNTFAGDIVLNTGARLNLAGVQVDEQRATTALETIEVNGGSLTAKAGHSVLLQEGSTVDVSAGIWRNASGKVTQGKAGGVDITLNTFAATGVAPETGLEVRVFDGQLQLGGRLKGFDFQSGGSLALSGLRTLTIADSGSNMASPTNQLVLDKAFFSDNGFGRFDLKAAGDVTVRDGVKLNPVLTNLVSQFRTRRGANAGAAELVARQQLDVSKRQGLAISLSATEGPAFSKAVPIQGLTQAGKVMVGKNAAINVGAGGSITLKAAGGVDVSGDLTARGGKLNLGILGARGGDAVATSSDNTGYQATELVILRDGAELDVSGIARTFRQADGRIGGEVLGGGSVLLNADNPGQAVRGRVVTEVGSNIKADGAQAELNIGQGGTTTISKGAGSIEVASADGFLLEGAMSAKRPNASAEAGRFVASIGTEGKPDFTKPIGAVEALTPYPQAERQLIVSAQAGQSTKEPRTDLYPEAEARGLVSAQQLQDAGFDRINLRSEGRIVLQDGVSIQAAANQAPLRSVVLDTRVLQAQGVDKAGEREHLIRATRVALGDVTQPLPNGASSPPTPEGLGGDAILNVQAGLIEVHGHSALQGIKQTTLDATLSASNVPGQRQDGEVRFIGRNYGISSSEPNQLTGSLAFDGDLTMKAGQAYATTLSKFDVKGRTGTSSLTVKAPTGGSSSQAPLSALAKLTLSAHDVTIAGVLRQPFGAITIQAETKPTLSADSLLSVSGDGIQVPVGSMVNQNTWVYANEGITPGEALNLLNGKTITTLSGESIEKGILVTGNGLTIDSTSRMEAQAGGDLLTWEFLAGVGGSQDTLARKDVFAIVPGYGYDFAPHDTEILASQTKAGTTWSQGEQIVITTDNGVLKPGRYTLLPARYGILPGAVLVSRTSSGSGDLLKQAVQRDDGSVLVAGYRTSAGSNSNEGNDSRLAFLLEPEATYRAQSDLSITSVSGFLSKQAAKLGEATPTMPGDAGRISLSSTGEAFAWDARYNLAGKPGLAGGQFDLSMAAKMALIENGAKAPEGYVGISASKLLETGAESILLGGVRSNPGTDSTVDVQADEVLLVTSFGKPGDGQSAKRGELLAVGKNKVEVRDGVTIQSGLADTGRDNQITIKGEGAALVVSHLGATSVTRDLKGVVPSSTPAQLVLGSPVKPGDAITKPGQITLAGAAVQLDTTGTVSKTADVTVKADTLGLGAKQVTIGATKPDDTTLVLDASVFDRKRVEVRSYSSIDIQGSQTIGQLRDGKPVLERLVLDAPMVRGLGASTDVAKVQAQQVVLRNGSNVTPDSTQMGQTSLVIEAQPPVRDATAEGITIDKGQQRLAFQNTTLSTTGDIVFRDVGQLQAQKDITLTAARVTAASDTKHGIDAKGVIKVQAYQGATAEDKGRTLNDTVGIGAKLALSGARVVQQGHVSVASGQLTLRGTGDASSTEPTVLLAEGSKTEAAGAEIKNDGQLVAVAPGGRIDLIADKGQVAIKGLVDVSAPDASKVSQVGVAAGVINVTATDTAEQAGLLLSEFADIRGSAGKASQSGRFTANVARMLTETRDADNQAVVSIGSLDRLATALKTGGFKREIDLRTTKDNLSLSTALNAGRVRITADGGKLNLKAGASIDTTEAAERGGVVQLAALSELTLESGARIQAKSTAEGANGGDVLLASGDGKYEGEVWVNGKVILQEGSSVVAGEMDDQGEAQDGRITVRAQILDKTTTGKPFDTVNVALNGATQAGEVIVEAVKVFDAQDSKVEIDAAMQKVYTDAADAFMLGKSQVLTDIGLDSDTTDVKLRFGVEQRSNKSIVVKEDWKLNRVGKEAMNLTLRASEEVKVNGSVSDGFTTATRAAANAAAPSTLTQADAGSIRIVAGADTTSADVLRTSDSAAGDLTVAAGKMIRTTNGSIDLAASHDIILTAGKDSSEAQAVVYVTGRTADVLANDTSKAMQSKWQQFTHQGGNVSLTAGHNITAPAATQGFGNWFLHTGTTANTVAWASAFDAFRQGVGSMGGGNVRVVAGGEIRNLGVVAPTSARTYSEGSNAPEQLIENGGDVLIRAGGNVAGGMFFVGRGQGDIEAGGTIVTGDVKASALTNVKAQEMAPVLGLMDGQWHVQAQGDVSLSAVYNPTALDSTSSATSNSRVPSTNAGSYVTYSDTAGVSLSSVTGDVNWRSDLTLSTAGVKTSALLNLHSEFSPAAEKLKVANNSEAARSALMLAPPVLETTSYNRDVTWQFGADNLLLSPSAKGDLRMYAGQDIKLRARETTTGGETTLNKVEVVMLDIDLSNQSSSPDGSVKKPVSKGSVNWVKELPTFGKLAGLHAGDARRSLIFAGRDIDVNGINLQLPKQVDVLAQGKIDGLGMRIYHNQATDVSRIQAAGNVLGATSAVLDDGRSEGLIQLNGPGELQVQAGRTLDLSSSAGIEATGAGATLRVAAGMNKQVDVDAMVSAFLSQDAQARAALVQEVETVLNLKGLSYEQALAYFRDMTPAHQAAFVQRKLVLPKFARQYVSDDSAKSDVAWSWYAQATGQNEADLASAAYQDYQTAQRALVSYVESTTKQSGLSFADALTRYRQMTPTEQASFVDKKKTVSAEAAMAFLASASTKPYAQAWDSVAAANKVDVSDVTSPVFSRFMEDVLLKEVQRLGSVASAVADSANPLFNPRRAAVRDAIWSSVSKMATAAGLDRGFVFNGDLDLSTSKVHTKGTGSITSGGIDLFVPGGQVLVGSATATAADRASAATRGIATYGGGGVRSYSSGDFQVASQKVHIVGSGDMVLYSSKSNIDSGRGSNTAVTVPPKEAVDDGYGVYKWLAGKATVGSGMAIFQDDLGRREGKISLLAPRGEVRALDAFIDAPSVDIAGPVLGADNLKGSVAGTAAAPAVTVNLTVNSGLGTETAAGQAQESMAAKQDKSKERSSLLTVDVLDIGSTGDAPAAKPDAAQSCKDGKACPK